MEREMLGFVQSFFAPRCNPIGIDFGSDCLRMAQVMWTGEEYKLLAAASADVPPHVRTDVGRRFSFFVETVKDLLGQGGFRGRQVTLGLPASNMFVRHLRMPKLDDEGMRKALPWELRGKLPIDPMNAVLRHVIAGEVYQDQEPKYEVIVVAAAREMVNQLLAAASRAKLDVVGMNIEPKAIIDCFAHVYRRKSDETATSCYVDIGCSAARAVIARGSDMLFGRVIPIGGDQFSRAVGDSLKIPLQDAKILRVRLCAQQNEDAREKMQGPIAEASPAAVAAPETVRRELDATAGGGDNSFALLGAALRKAENQETIQRPAPAAAPATAVAEPQDDGDETETAKINSACREPLYRMIEELNLCRRYYESTFPEKPIDRLIFVGGEARQRLLCQQVAREMGLAAQVGDPLVRMGRISEIGPESGIDRRQPQPAWAVAIGLSMGPRAGASATVGAGASTGAAASSSAGAETTETTRG
jgi:type IV pilus assembly protein PilM